MRTNGSSLFSGRKLIAALAPLLLLVGLRAQSAQDAGTFYVTLTGNDQWSGKAVTSNSSKTDGPFATVERALQAVRDSRKGGGNSTAGSATILVGPGCHTLTKPLILTPQDSNITIAGFGDQWTVLSGGRPITGWKRVERDGKQLWVVDLPQVRNENWIFRELWVNGRREIRARYPNTGYLKVAGVVDPKGEWTQGQTRFRYNPDDLKPWKTLNEGEVVVMNRWVDSRLPISRIDEAKRVIEFTKRSVFALEDGDPYYLEGTFEGLDAPGEWYLDRERAELYYLPRQGESPNRVVAFAPYLSQVLRMEGHPEKEQFVENVTIKGVMFSHTEWCFPEGFATSKNKPAISPEPAAEVGGFGQAEVGVPGAVWGEGVRNCLFENCSFRDLGNYGLELSRGCISNRIVGCDFAELGAGGVKLGETAIRETSEQTRGNEITGCWIHDGGKMFHSAIGVWIGQSPDNRIVHNSIHDFYYTGISIGWTWGYGPALASNNLVAFNHVHHIGMKSDSDGPILSDMGGIYTLGKQPGSRVENNLWHDIAGLRYGGWGIYFDEGSSGIVASSNVVYRTTHGGFHQHYGETNILRNNVFAFARDHQLQRTRVEPHVSFSFETNIVYFDLGVLLGGDWSKDSYQMDWNVYFDARPGIKAEEIRFAGATLEEWRKRGHDVHSIIEDPQFLDPAQYDFHFRPNSPALKSGFQPIDLRSVGPPKQ
jgi:hypothetical protein